MWLKAITTTLIVFSIGMLFAYPWLVGVRPPKGRPKIEQVQYLRRGAIYIGVEAAALIGAIGGAYLVARRARRDFLELSRINMEALLEATLRDHAKKDGPEEASNDAG